MADKPDDLIEGDFSVKGERPPPQPLRYDWRQNPPPWTPPTEEESAGVAGVIGSLVLAGAIGAIHAWWKLHH